MTARIAAQQALFRVNDLQLLILGGQEIGFVGSAAGRTPDSTPSGQDQSFDIDVGLASHRFSISGSLPRGVPSR